jgi:hypothetical protein
LRGLRERPGARGHGMDALACRRTLLCAPGGLLLPKPLSSRASVAGLASPLRSCDLTEVSTKGAALGDLAPGRPRVEVEEPARPSAGITRRLRLVSLSLLMLFLELALIRWTAANNTYLAYITNFVLLASFLGVGVGFLLANSARLLFRWTPVPLVALVAFVLGFPVKLVTLAGPHELQGANGMAVLPQWLSLSVIFLLVVAVMAGVGQGVARTFRQFQPLDAYRYDILGSIAGIVVFSLLSFVGLPPISWGLVVAAGLVVMMGWRMRWWQWGAVVLLVVLLLLESLSSDIWSPYYKITAVRPPHTRGVLVVSANNIPHQTAYPVKTLRWLEPFYFFPYRHVSRRSLDNVLVIGAGTGNDVAVALSEGAKHVDAVEIDPELAQLGREYNADRPYQSPRVSVHIADGREYLQQTHTRYNLVLFALPDSLTVLAGQSSLRLENFLLTTESIQAVKQHLAPNGTFSMYNYYQPFLLDRYATMVKSVFGRAPCAELGAPLQGRRQSVLTVDANGPAAHCSTVWRGRYLAPATDDHPFPYLSPSSTIPPLYLWTIALILAVSFMIVRAAGGPLRDMTRYLDLFCMGGAFMLLETKNIVQFALLFGTTWFVNSLVFAGVLCSVFAAVEVARHVKLPRPGLLYAALIAGLGVTWLVPPSALLGLSPAPRFVAASALAFAPIFLANLVFSQRFKEVGSSTVAFGANLLGAIVGGVLEYLSLVTGYRFLLVLVAVLYGLAFVLGRRQLYAAYF